MKVSAREMACLKVLADAYPCAEQNVLFYSHIVYETGLELTQARRAVRALARKGLAKRSSCYDYDGMLAGSGYSATAIGFETAQPSPILPEPSTPSSQESRTP